VQSDPNLHCILLGARAHAYSDALRAAAERLGIGDRVSFLARRADPRPLYRGADLALCPSYQESLPRALLEAMACALPIVASDVDGIPELVRDGREARLVAPGDPAALAAAIRELLADPSRAAALGSAARKRVESEFPLARSTERFEALFDDLLAGG
jgi:glycosyltransferase involved in cell wall biosynthesis